MEVFLARQPIMNRRQQVFAYELLFRAGLDNVYNCTDGNRATATVINNSLFTIGLDEVTGGKLAFINFPRQLLVDEIPTLLPPDQVAIEILEDVQPDEEVVAACTKFKQAGYILALDDFVLRADYKPLIELADIIKVDFLATPPAERAELIKRLDNNRIKFLAEKVETYADFRQGMQLGYSYFQGYYFCRPTLISGRQLPGSYLTFFQALQEISQPEPNFNRLEGIIKRDLAFSYSILKLVNSAAFGLRNRVKSIKHAVVLLGLREMRKLISLCLMRGVAKDKPEELLTCSIVRGRFGELIAECFGLVEWKSDLFFTGLFSMIDALLEKPMDEILNELPLSERVRDALKGKAGDLRNILNLIICYEQGNWAEIKYHLALLSNLGIRENELPHLYRNSLVWANNLLG
ncbi:MAG TPA: HDOD domain-containing protein [Bacillota bacterium]|nr:HDOD domain-containing protein [Bacillota bacterium]